MDVEELIRTLQRAVSDGRIDPEEVVMVRDLSVSEGAMEAGSSGYAELEEVLIFGGTAHLLISEAL